MDNDKVDKAIAIVCWIAVIVAIVVIVFQA